MADKQFQDIDVSCLPDSPFAFAKKGCVWKGQKYNEGDCVDPGIAGSSAICTDGRWMITPGPCPQK